MFVRLVGICLALSLWVTASPLPDTSLYHLPSQWTDQNGRSLSLEELRGKVRVVALVYTQCQSVCPAIILAMKNTEASLSIQEKAQVGFVLVSIDPSVDTSAQLKEFAAAQKLGPTWSLLRGSPADVRELATTLDFKYRKTSSKDYAHTAMITVLDGQGEIVHQQVGLAVGAAERLKVVRKLLKAGP